MSNMYVGFKTHIRHKHLDLTLVQICLCYVLNSNKWKQTFMIFLKVKQGLL
jgi:hypothetical protein